FLTRERNFESDEHGYAHASKLVDESPLPTPVKCALFFEAERRYWQRRNRAAQVQKARQDKLGLGWGNHDHHTYRCSRVNFARHGDSFRQAGMNHLEAQFDFDSLRDQLEREDVKTMKPFTNFPYLRQAFTEGERWTVDAKRIDRALQAGWITDEQAQKFREQ